ncbi:acetyltransferase [Lithospermum erythrorhizon]|uniref:Acetyltransferase n=1 Tax=Lithospermum erythrorhizon TaxID=34254 RepID=A0AAV3P6D7_LITER
MLLYATASLRFSVTRKNIELVRPTKPTPHESKLLSDIDDQEANRIDLPTIPFYRRREPPLERKDPVKVIRDSLAVALVFYYPLAGRLRELRGRKLMVECTSERMLFIEADASVKLEEFGEDGIRPPSIPCLDQLIYVVPSSSGIINSPLRLIQVTRLICDGFILAICFNHTKLDGFALIKILTAMGEIARGILTPSVLPIWQRELFCSRHPPRITHIHPEYDQFPNEIRVPRYLHKPDSLIPRSFFFGPEEISTLMSKLVSNNSRKISSSFNLVAACVWCCRTIVLQFDPTDEVRFLCVVRPLIPITTAGELVENVDFAVELISKIKFKATKEHLHSVADFMVLKGRPPFSLVRTYVVSDNTSITNENVDFGWGKSESASVASFDGVPSDVSFYIPFEIKNSDHGGKGIMVPISLPAEAMERFAEELGIMLNNGDKFDAGRNGSVRSAL